MKNVLNFLALLDSKGKQLSLTNILMIVVIVKIALAHSVGLTELGALFLSLLSYSHKRYVNSVAAKQSTEEQKTFNTLTDQVAGWVELLNSIKLDIEKIENKQKEDSKIVSEAKTLLTANRLSQGMGGR